MNNDTLILYYYDDGLTDDERQQVESAINDDPVVAARYDALCRELNRLSETDTPAVPAHTVRRWHAAIDDAAGEVPARTTSRRRRFSPASFAWGAALAAALVIGISLRPTAIDPVVEQPAGFDGTFARGLQVHFRDTYQRLAALPVDSTTDRGALVTQIIEQNRMYERAARNNGADDLARVLRAFEPVLARLAAEDTAPEDAEALRRQLVFELNVMLTKLSHASSKTTGPLDTGIQT